MADGTNAATQFPNLPERIRGLERLSYNLWWSWHRQAREMFPALDLQAWRESDHNPLRMLAMLEQQSLDEAVSARLFLRRIRFPPFSSALCRWTRSSRGRLH